MAEPFVFHFKPGPDGRPEILYILDLDCICGLCGHKQFQRFYHSTPFHSLTLTGLEKRVTEGPLKAGYECENCGEAVGANQVGRTALTYGFADDAGLLQIFDDLNEKTRRYEITARRRLDPQATPRWAPDEEAPEEGRWTPEELTDDIVEDCLGRPFNLKLAWRDLLEDWLDDPEGGAYSRLAKDLWVVTDGDEQAASELAQEITDQDFWDAYDEGDLAVISLHDSIPTGLATHEHPDLLSGRWPTWLDASLRDVVDQQDAWVDAYISRTAAIESLTRAFDVARLTYKTQRTDADTYFSEITTPTKAVYGRGISVSSLLRRAVYTGMTPGEAARLTAEEVIGVLLQVWKA